MDNTEGPVYYMPHHAVIREERTTKTRVVFDASAHARGHASLNESLNSGPNLNADLVGLLLKFRTHRIALVADIETAFLQIAIHKCDRDAPHYFWFERVPVQNEPLPRVTEW